MATPRLNVRGEILKWARESIGLELPDAADRLQLSAEKLLDWETNGGDPTSRQLDALGALYVRCVDVFFMPSPPKNERPRPLDRRTYFGGHFRKRLTRPTIIAIREAQEAQETFASLRHAMGEPAYASLPTLTLGDEPEAAALRLRGRLRVDLGDQQQWAGEYRPLREWRRAVERLGILVLQPTMPLRELGGFSLIGEPPIIAVNPADFPTARVFTIMHELTHLALGESGLCNPDGTFSKHARHNAIESFCNAVAGRILVPEAALLEQPTIAELRVRQIDTFDALADIAARFRVSRGAVLWRLYEVGLVNRHTFDSLRAQLARIATAAKNARKAKRSSEFRPSPVKMAIRRFGPTLVSAALEAHDAGRISHREVSQFLRTKVDYLDSLGAAIGTA